MSEFDRAQNTEHEICPLNPLTPELNPSAQHCLPRFFTGDFNFKGFTARRLYKSFGFKGLMSHISSYLA
jgi:hypothetical protein